ncbi:MAG: ATP-binding cassette domain-containing protein, partial [Gluconacetobacter diazotrophicus]|nr:ATP-binding cassette domain-containing protein [Gluconacetobacter diazotrophicus]
GFFCRWIPAAVLAVVAPALVLSVVCAVQPRAALVLLCCGIAVPVAQAVFGIGAGLASRRQFVAMARLQGRFLDRVRGIATLVVSGQADAEALRLHDAADELRRRTMRVLRVAFLSSAALDCAFAVALVLIALLDGRALLSGGAARSWVGALLLPRSLFALLLVPEFFAPLRAFALAYQDRMQAAGAAESLQELHPSSPDADPPRAVSAAVRLPQSGSGGGIPVGFDRVRFTWDPARGRTLRDVSFRVSAGETVVLAGASGSGKTTIIEMLLGFNPPESGTITLDGVDIAAIPPAALSRLVSWIGQKPVLFAGSIRDNVLFARADATDEQLARAVRDARLDGFAHLLPRGLDTQVGEGGYGLSGGQAQRIAIARAFLRDAPLLLLDEPTSHLDPDTEREVMESLHRLAAGRTVILAGHSAAVLAFVRRRIVLADGRVSPVPADGVPA